MKKKHILLFMLGMMLPSLFAQQTSQHQSTTKNLKNKHLNKNNSRINSKNSAHFGNFDFLGTNALGCCDVKNLDDISFGYSLGAALTASALIKEARDKALNQWFDRQHTVLKNEIEKQLGKSFSNYKEARNAYFKHHETIAIQRNHSQIERTYNDKRYAKEHQKTSTLKKLKLLQLRENELKQGWHTHSNYASFSYNGKPLDQIQSQEQLATLWKEELSRFSTLHVGRHNDYHTYLKLKELGGITDSNHPLLEKLLQMQVNNFNRYDRWQQLDALQAYLNKIRPPWELPEGYISPVSYATADYLENYALKNKGGGWSIFDTTIDHYGGYAGYVQWMQKRRKAAIERLLAEVKVASIFNELTGKAKCLNNHLDKKGNSFIKDIFSEFQGDSKFHIHINSKYSVFKNGVNTGHGINAKTRYIKNSNFIHIEISTSKLLNMPALAAARTLIHEYIHADMYRKIYTDNYDGDLDFKTTYEKYEIEKQHNSMANLYLNSIKDALKKFHKNILVGDYNYLTNNGTNPLPDIFYEALAWQGLKDDHIKSYSDLPNSKKTALTNALNAYYHSTTKNCPN